MKIINILKTAFSSIMKARMRSLLTALGIIIGVSAVIVMVAVGTGSQRKVEEQISSLGSNLIIIFPGSSRMGGINRGAGSINRFTMEDADKIKEEAALIKAVSPIITTGEQVIGGAGNWNTRVWGVSENYLSDIRDWKLTQGEYFTERDVRSSAKVAIIGTEIVKNLFPNESPIGEMIRIRNVPFKVIGVLEEKGQSAMGTSNDDVIYAPATTVLNRLSGRRFIGSIQASAISLDKIDEAQAELTTIMREAHRLREGEEDDFSIRNQADITEAASQTTEILTLLLGSVAGVSLLVGGIGIMNIMLVSVTERTREIGIRLSIGARDTDILIQFLTEAIALSLTGGIIGILLSLGVAFIMNNYTSLPAVISPEIIALSFSFAGAVGIFFGFYPARKASRMNPIDALRYE